MIRETLVKLPSARVVVDNQELLDALGEQPLVWTDDEYTQGLRDQYYSDKTAIASVLFLPDGNQSGTTRIIVGKSKNGIAICIGKNVLKHFRLNILRRQ